MKVQYMLERFFAESGTVEVSCWPEEFPAIIERFAIPLINQEGMCPETTEEVVARIEAAIPVSWLETRIKRHYVTQDTSHISQLQGKPRSINMEPQEQGVLKIRVLGE